MADPMPNLTRFARAAFYLGLVLFLMICGGALRAATEPAGPEISVKMIGDETAGLYVCAKLEPGTLTCLDMPTYVARIKAKVEEQRHKADM